MRILFLQGPANGFFARLAAEAAQRGHDFLKINYCGGDETYWRGGHAVRCRVGAEDLPAFYADLFAGWRPDAVLLFGDCRPVHVPAVALARQRGLPAWVFDEGYLRPDWITMDLFGANARSCIPRDPATLRAIAGRIVAPAPPRPFGPAWTRRGFDDTAYRLANGLLGFRYPRYRNHRLVPAWREYGGWIKRTLQDKARSGANRAAYGRALAPGGPLFVLPLQLDNDFQIRRRSPFRDMAAVLRHVIADFAAHAPADAHLAIKRHPLDDGRIDRFHLVRALARRCGVEGRVHYFVGGVLAQVLERARGVVTVNSTAAIAGLDRGLPVKVLGESVYAVPGLVSPQPLDSFWRDPTPPEAALHADFRKVATALTQLNASLYSSAGQRSAATAALDRVEDPRLFRELGWLPARAPAAAPLHRVAAE